MTMRLPPLLRAFSLAAIDDVLADIHGTSALDFTPTVLMLFSATAWLSRATSGCWASQRSAHSVGTHGKAWPESIHARHTAWKTCRSAGSSSSVR